MTPRAARCWRCCSSRWRPRWARAADAHPIDAASLTLKEIEPGRFAVRFQAGSPSLQRQLSTAPAVFPPPCRLDGASLECGAAGLVGTIAFPWLEGTTTRLMVEIEWLDGARLLRIATASARTLTVYGGTGGLARCGPSSPTTRGSASSTS